jgi:hypothetical protein
MFIIVFSAVITCPVTKETGCLPVGRQGIPACGRQVAIIIIPLFVAGVKLDFMGAYSISCI